MPPRRSFGGGNPHRYNERMTSAGPPRCPACGGLRLLSPSSFDPGRRWRCLDCGTVWPEQPVPSRPPKEGLRL
jgi:tRNA(Ile2) C34 agmatinyltransferase TiaS